MFCRIGTIGEDMLVDISEVLFNELSYYELLKDQGYIYIIPIYSLIYVFV